MRPTDDTSIILNVEREFVVLIAPYDTFEARTIKAYERVYDQFGDVRIDRSLRFLVSRDLRIEEHIRHFLSGQIEYPIIIPFTYHGPWLAQDIYAQIRRNHAIRDLFGFQAPLKTEYFFFGRSALISEVIDLHKAGQNSGLFGLRKSGKTSTIYAIQRRARSSGVRSIIIDCQNPEVHARPLDSLLFHIVSEIRRAHGLRSVDFPTIDDPAEISKKFREATTAALGEVGSDVLLILDEIENISPGTAASPHWRHGRDSVLLWQTLRSFFQSARRYKICFCLVGTNPSLLEAPKIEGLDNPVYLFARKMFIPNLAEADTRKMLKHLGFFMGMDFPDEVISYIHNVYGGHPFFTRLLCSEIHKTAPPLTRPIKISKRMCDDAMRVAKTSTKGYINEIFDSLARLYPEEYELLQLLACDDLEGFAEYVEEEPELVEHLLGYHVIAKRENDYEFVADNIRSVLRSRLRVGKGAVSEQRWSEISQRRNKLEHDIRVALFLWARNIDDGDWEDACRNCIKRHVAEKGVPTRREAFSRWSSPLYLLDLMRFIQHSGLASGGALKEMHISSAFHCVNKYRADAHAKALSEEEFEACKNALDLLESVFSPPE